YSDNMSSLVTTTVTCFPPVVNSGPVSVTNCVGTTATFNVDASGTGLNYQWYRGTSILSGKTASSLVLSNVSVGDAGNYSVVVSGTCGNTITNSATLTVVPLAITCPALVTVAASAGLCGATNIALGAPTASAICGAVTITNNAPALFAVGTNTVIWTVTDSHGNIATCPQTVIVTDTQPPRITCPVLVTVVASPGLCGATNVALGTPTVS